MKFSFRSVFISFQTHFYLKIVGVWALISFKYCCMGRGLYEGIEILTKRCCDGFIVVRGQYRGGVIGYVLC